MAQRRQLVHEQTYRTTLLWLGWASTAIAIYFFLYLDTDIWSYIKQDQSKITWVIMIMFVLGVAISLSLTLSITNEAVVLYSRLNQYSAHIALIWGALLFGVASRIAM